MGSAAKISLDDGFFFFFFFFFVFLETIVERVSTLKVCFVHLSIRHVLPDPCSPTKIIFEEIIRLRQKRQNRASGSINFNLVDKFVIKMNVLYRFLSV
jgi:hypothetical protein